MSKINGLLIVLLSTTFYAFVYPLAKKANIRIPPFTTMAISSFTLVLIAVILSAIQEKGAFTKLSTEKNSLLLLILLGSVNFIAYWLLILGLKHIPVWQVTMFTLLTPILSGIFAYFLLGEQLSPSLFIGLSIVGIGLYIAVR